MESSVTRRVRCCVPQAKRQGRPMCELEASAMAGNWLGEMCPHDHSRKFMTCAVQKEEKTSCFCHPLEVSFFKCTRTSCHSFVLWIHVETITYDDLQVPFWITFFQDRNLYNLYSRFLAILCYIWPYRMYFYYFVIIYQVIQVSL